MNFWNGKKKKALQTKVTQQDHSLSGLVFVCVQKKAVDLLRSTAFLFFTL